MLIAGIVAAGALAARRVWHPRRHSGGGQLIHIAAPPEVDVRGATRLWLNLAGIAAPALKRVLWGQPHVSFEYAWNARNLDIRIWTPPRVPVALVQAAVTAAWPGATTTVTDADEPIAAGALARGAVMTFGADAYPLASEQDVEPLRALMAAADAGARGEQAIVQILARPASRRRQARLHRTADTVRGQSIVLMLVDILDPSSSRPRSPRTRTDRLTRRPAGRPGGAMFEVTVRYAVAATVKRRSP